MAASSGNWLSTAPLPPVSGYLGTPHQVTILDNCRPCVRGLDDLDGWMGGLQALLEVLARSKATDEEDGLSKITPSCRGSCTSVSYLDFVGFWMSFVQSFDPYKINLIFHHSLDVCYQWLKDLLHVGTSFMSWSPSREQRSSYPFIFQQLASSRFGRSSFSFALGKLT